MSIATNGIMFSDINFAQKVIESGLNNFNISLKGTNEKEYYENTNTYGFAKSIEGYKNLKQLNANVKLSFVLGNQSFLEINKLKECMVENQLDNIVFQFYKPSANDGQGVPEMEIIAKTCQMTYEIFKNTSIHFVFEVSIPLCLFGTDFLQELIKRKIIQTCCHIRKGGGIIFDNNFDILPCNHFVGLPLNKTNIDAENIINFWNSNDVTEFRKKINTYPHKKCQNCTLWKQCGGGCALRWLHISPEKIIK